MKTIYLILLFPLFTFFLKPNPSTAQTDPQFNVYMHNMCFLHNNITGADSLFQFDLYIEWTNSTDPTCNPFEYAGTQFAILFDNAFKGTGTLSASKVPISGGINFPTIIQNNTVSVTGNLFQASAPLVPSELNYIISTSPPGNRMLRVKIRTNQHTFASPIPYPRFTFNIPGKTLPAYFLPSEDPKDPDNQFVKSLPDTVVNTYYVMDPGIHGYPTHTLPISNFYSDRRIIKSGETVNFFDSSLFANEWSWTFNGAYNNSSTSQNPANVLYNVPGNYTVSLVAATQYTSDTRAKTAYITVTPSTRLNLSLYLQGAYDAAINEQRTDTVKFYLRNNSAPYAIVDSSRMITNPLGFMLVNFINTGTGSYFLVADHRNSIETWSSVPVNFTNGAASNYDMTQSASSAYGNNLANVDSSPAKFAVYGGDVIKNGAVNLADVLKIYNDASMLLTGYQISDVNIDNVVNLNDIMIAYNNAVMFVAKVTP